LDFLFHQAHAGCGTLPILGTLFIYFIKCFPALDEIKHTHVGSIIFTTPLIVVQATSTSIFSISKLFLYLAGL
jgi:hypothetical protein